MEALSEREFRERKIDPFLERYFYIQREVTSSCGTGRLDYVLQNKKTLELYGIEVKRNVKLRGESMGKNLLQCKRYTTLTWKTDFGRHVRLPIFLMPGISEQFVQIDKEKDGWCIKVPKDHKLFYRGYHSHGHTHHNLNSIISTAFDIGEVKTAEFYGRKNLFFSFNNKMIWSAVYGVHKNNYNFLMKKVNSL